MHELSIAQSLIERATDVALLERADVVLSLRLRIGDLAGVDTDALRFSFDLAAEGTPCAGARLEIERVPVTARCPRCDQATELASPYRFVCAVCGDPTSELVTGNELELTAVEIDQDEPARA